MSMVDCIGYHRLGHIFVADGRYRWMQSHAQVPQALDMQECIRIYFGCRSKQESSGNYTSYTTYLDVDRNDPTQILYIHDRPVLEVGGSGTFDQHGIMPSHVMWRGDEVWLYYGGWSRSIGVPYQLALGLAISQDGGRSFKKYSRGPIFGRTPTEPFGQNSLWVGHVNGAWQMVYSSILEWVEHQGKQEAIYLLLHAESDDGLEWRRDGRQIIPARSPGEAQCVPTGLMRDGAFHLWFSSRNGLDFRHQAQGGYHIGHATTTNFKIWQRTDEAAGLQPSGNGWDGEMACYPCAIEIDDKIFLFYCGNHFGREGFGVAQLTGLGK